MDRKTCGGWFRTMVGLGETFGLKGSINLIMCVTYVLIGRQGTWALAYKRVVAAVLCCRVVEFPPVSQWSMLRPGCIVAPA